MKVDEKLRKYIENSKACIVVTNEGTMLNGSGEMILACFCVLIGRLVKEMGRELVEKTIKLGLMNDEELNQALLEVIMGKGDKNE